MKRTMMEMFADAGARKLALICGQGALDLIEVPFRGEMGNSFDTPSLIRSISVGGGAAAFKTACEAFGLNDGLLVADTLAYLAADEGANALKFDKETCKEIIEKFYGVEEYKEAAGSLSLLVEAELRTSAQAADKHTETKVVTPFIGENKAKSSTARTWPTQALVEVEARLTIISGDGMEGLEKISVKNPVGCSHPGCAALLEDPKKVFAGADLAIEGKKNAALLCKKHYDELQVHNASVAGDEAAKPIVENEREVKKMTEGELAIAVDKYRAIIDQIALDDEAVVTIRESAEENKKLLEEATDQQKLLLDAKIPADNPAVVAAVEDIKDMSNEHRQSQKDLLAAKKALETSEGRLETFKASAIHTDNYDEIVAIAVAGGGGTIKQAKNGDSDGDHFDTKGEPIVDPFPECGLTKDCPCDKNTKRPDGQQGKQYKNCCGTKAGVHAKGGNIHTGNGAIRWNKYDPEKS